MQEKGNTFSLKGLSRYLNEYHKQRSLACEKAVEEMSKHPLSYEEKMRQIKALERAEKEGAW